MTQVGRGPPITNAVLVPIFLLEIGFQGLPIAQLNRLIGSIKPPGHSSVTPLTKTHAVGLLAVVMVVGGIVAAFWPSRDVGYVQINTVPAKPIMQAGLYLDATKLAPIHQGGTLLRQPIGTLKLQAETLSGERARSATLWSNETGLRPSPYRFWSVRRGASAGSPVAAIPGPYLRQLNVCTLLPRAEVN